MELRRTVSTLLIGAMFFFAPSTIPSGTVKAVQLQPSCGSGPFTWLPTDTAFAGISIRVPPCPTSHTHTSAWPWVVIGCAGSIVLSALVANFRDNRQLTTAEAWTCGLLYWIPMPYQATAGHH